MSSRKRLGVNSERTHSNSTESPSGKWHKWGLAHSARTIWDRKPSRNLPRNMTSIEHLMQLCERKTKSVSITFLCVLTRGIFFSLPLYRINPDTALSANQASMSHMSVCDCDTSARLQKRPRLFDLKPWEVNELRSARARLLLKVHEHRAGSAPMHHV